MNDYDPPSILDGLSGLLAAALGFAAVVLITVALSYAVDLLDYLSALSAW